MSKIELKPCPFCGGEVKIKRAFLSDPKLVERTKGYALEQDFCIECSICKYESRDFTVSLLIDQNNLSLKSTLEQEVQYWVKRWNRRADDEQREADI